MRLNKEILKKKFQKDVDRYWKVKLFEEKGFIRKQCPFCDKGFWTLDPEREHCPQPVCGEPYGFINNPITKGSWDYIETWKRFEKFFTKRGHESIGRYPVISHWRDDLFFTIASIVDFQRLERGKVTFEYPTNPLIVPQMCLRFGDVSNVGRTGRHHTCFMMPGQHAFNPPKEGYWKDRCIELNFEFMTKVMGIPKEELIYLEEVWAMPDFSALGPYIETFSRGLELVNSGFMEFKGANSGLEELEMKVIDVGWGHERLVWFSQGTLTGYDAVFGPVVEKMKKICRIECDREFFLKYAKLAGRLDIDGVLRIKPEMRKVAQQLGVSLEELEKRVTPLQALYAIADYTRALTFAIADGGIVSNVGGGYNLRVILRRALQFIDQFKWDLDLAEICGWHADYLKPLFPELVEHKEEIKKLLEVEEKRFRKTRKRTREIVKEIVRRKRRIGGKKLIELYDSKGITPEMLREAGLKIEIPPNFYEQVTERHMGEKPVEEKPKFNVSGLPKTKLLYYENPDLFKVEAKVLKILDNHVILDQTNFYPRGGGQEPDNGLINGCRVTDVDKIGDVVIHELEKINFREGQKVACKVDKERREILKKHHTATHIINYASRKILGPHIWQHSAFKDVDKARLDITHYESLRDKEAEQIENLANEIVEKDLPVRIEWLPRSKAEGRYGFRLYQGGVPGKTIRVVSIGEDHEACGGLHCKSTGEVGFITITRTKRIQDGVDRIEYMAGSIALSHLKARAKTLKETASLLKVKEREVPKAVEKMFKKWKRLKKEVKIKYV